MLSVRVSADAQAGEVRAAVLVVDVVRVREDLLGVGGVPLQRDVDHDRALPSSVGRLGGERDHLVVDRLLGLVEQLDELADAALVLEALLLAFAALVGELDDEARVQERELAQTAGQDVVAVFGAA